MSRSFWRLLLVGSLLFGCVGCDQVTKELARSQLVLGETHSFLGDTFRLIHVENPGAFLGIGANLPESWRLALLQGGVLLLVCALLWMAAFRRGQTSWQVAGFTLLAASGVGNLIDRLLFDGRVTDFLNLGIGDLRTGIFNVADIAGMAGAVLLVFATRRTPPPQSPHAGYP